MKEGKMIAATDISKSERWKKGRGGQKKGKESNVLFHPRLPLPLANEKTGNSRGMRMRMRSDGEGEKWKSY